jgi:ketosteroid isomerase-like protein
MSQQNVEIARRGFEAWQRDDFDAWLSYIDPDVEWLTAIERGLGRAGNVFHGHEGMREFWSLWRTEVDDFWAESDEIRDLGGERVLHLAHIQFRGRASGIMVESHLALVVTIRDGKIVRSEDYLSHKEAPEDVGLSE